jgi:hypothetical protein
VPEQATTSSGWSVDRVVVFRIVTRNRLGVSIETVIEVDALDVWHFAHAR